LCCFKSEGLHRKNFFFAFHLNILNCSYTPLRVAIHGRAVHADVLLPWCKSTNDLPIERKITKQIRETSCKEKTQICVLQGSLTFIPRKFNSDLILRCKFEGVQAARRPCAASGRYTFKQSRYTYGARERAFIAERRKTKGLCVYQIRQCLMKVGLLLLNQPAKLDSASLWQFALCAHADWMAGLFLGGGDTCDAPQLGWYRNHIHPLMQITPKKAAAGGRASSANLLLRSLALCTSSSTLVRSLSGAAVSFFNIM